MADNFIKSNKAFLGRGWGFPPTFSKAGKGVSMLEAEEDIKSSLQVLLSTSLGERVMEPGFGANMDEYVFDSLNTTFTTYLTEQIRVAIINNEPRVELDDVTYDEDTNNGKIDITVYYRVLSTNTRYNIVYPFFINEGTDLEGQ